MQKNNTKWSVQALAATQSTALTDTVATCDGCDGSQLACIANLCYL